MSPLLHPRLRKSRDKPSIHIIMRLTIYFWQSVIEFAFSKQSVNGANANWFKAYGTPFVTKIHLFIGVLLAYKDSF